MAKNKRSREELDKEMWAARYAKYKKMVAAYPRCSLCDYPVMTWEDSRKIWEATKIRAVFCNGFAYLQTDGYAEEIKGDHSLYMLCDGENHNNMMDI
jgi:hypothetical protein